MKLCITFLLIAFTCVMATPTPLPEDNPVLGPMMKTSFNMFEGMTNTMGNWMKGGMDFAKDVTEKSKDMMVSGFKSMAKTVGL